MREPLRLDALVIGGGIAGLWLAARLRRAGYSVLVASETLGGGQTAASQGIVHGGTKYLLGGRNDAGHAPLADAPEIWRRALAGGGDVDLGAARLLSPATYLWGARDALSRILVPLAALALRSDAALLTPAEWPEALRDAPQVGGARRLDEPVLDVATVVSALARDLECIAIGRDGFEFDGDLVRLDLAEGDQLAVAASRVFVVAGAGNERALAQLGEPASMAQRRPLQMVLAKGPLPDLFGHLVGVSDKPRLTVTTHRAGDGAAVWYLGGGLAEAAAGKAPEVAVASAREILQTLLPGAVIDALRFATVAVDRAEAAGPGGLRPAMPVWLEHGRYRVGWPSKLALAPKLAAMALQDFRIQHPHPSSSTVRLPPGSTRPPLAVAPWDEPLPWR